MHKKGKQTEKKYLVIWITKNEKEDIQKKNNLYLNLIIEK